MSIKSFRLGNIDMFEDPDAANEKLELWLEVTIPRYLDSPEYQYCGHFLPGNTKCFSVSGTF